MKKTIHKFAILLATTALLSGIPVAAFAYQAAPVAITKSATFITEKGARLNGQGNPSEMPDAYQWFEWGMSGRSGVVYETPHYALGSWYGNNLTDTSADIYGLAPSTQYFYRQIVENGRGKDVGNTVYFTTKALVANVPPLVIAETNDPSQVGELTATLRGYVSPHGNTATRAWFEWGPSQRLEGQTPSVGVSSNAGFFESALSNLTPGTIYFYRVVAENSSGRTYGAMRVFTTAGTPPPPPEEKVNQAVPTPSSGDGVARTTSSSGVKLASNQDSSGLPGANMSNLPGDFFGFFRKKTTNTTTNTDSGSINTSGGTTVVNPSEQVAAVGESKTPLGMFWNALTGSRATEVTIEKVGPDNVPMHTPVEYRIAYRYRESSVATGAKLRIIIPSDVIYIGDNTNNELLLEEGSGGGERTYVLPVGRMETGGARTLSILGMTTGSAKGFPDARARLEYKNGSGTHVVASGVPGNEGSGSVPAESQSAATSGSGSGNGILPSSFLGWMIYVVLIVAAIIGIRKGREFYEKRKEAIEAMEKEDDHVQLARMLPTSGRAPLEA